MATTFESMTRRNLVVVGNGMVGHKLVETLIERGATAEWDIITFCEENRVAYDRVGLTSFFSGTSVDELSLVEPGFYEQAGLQIHIGDAAVSIDRNERRVTSALGKTISYDALVLATGSYPFVPSVPGHDLSGCFVYRTIDDLEAIGAASKSASVGAVIGGGLLGLEAANALRTLGLETHVVEFAPRLMPVQIDEGGGEILRRRIEELGVNVHTGMQTSEIVPDEDGEVASLRFVEGEDLPIDLLVFSAGIRPRDELARSCGLELGERGGVLIDGACRTSDPAIYAIGECALFDGRTYGLVAPGYDMARVVADQILGGEATFKGSDMSTKLKLMGVDVASFGDAFATTEGAKSITYTDSVTSVYKRLVVDRAGKVLGGVLVGDTTSYQTLLQMMRGDVPTPDSPGSLLAPAGVAGAMSSIGVGALSDEAMICSCNNVTKKTIVDAICSEALREVGEVKTCTKAGSSCGGCIPLVTDLLKEELTKSGVELSNALCEHFDYSRQELFDIVRVHRYSSFFEILTHHGRGQGCEICKPAIASILASLGNGYILSPDQAPLQDTNDHFLANMQRDGTYSVVPRVPGGEITPDQLIAVGEVAKEFGLYTKITGGQRIDLLGAVVDDLPRIWERLIAAGMESGHAYGKALRTVKSCVGLTWCRYGQQDSTKLAIDLELRYRGLRSPHKLKSAVSGCTRECAEAQSKDFGIIATERGWNLYVCGNGGMKPQHAVLLAEDLDSETLVKLIDRFLMFYIRTADRLERTATWFNKLVGGIDYLRSVVIDDVLGICEELEADMAHHVATYECEWKATIDDAESIKRFRSFVNSPEIDPSVVMVPERDQMRPATYAEKIERLAPEVFNVPVEIKR